MTEKYYYKKEINRYLDNLYDADEIDRLQEMIRSEIDSEYLDERMKELWIEYLDSSDKSDYDKEKLRKEAYRLISQTGHSKQKNREIRKWAGIAAAILILVATSLTVYFTRENKQLDPDIAYHEFTVPYGDKKEIKLADGSRVILNAGTTIRYPEQFRYNERNIYLNGEAFFSVSSNPKQPFIVSSDNMSIRVLGTEFNVKTYGEDELASVSVKSGKVQVETEEMSSRLVSGEQITLNNRTKDYQKKQVELKHITYWVQGGLAFYETPITDVAKELTRIYNRKIRFEDGQNFNNLIMGEHDNKSIESVLKSIEYSSGIKFRKENEEYILYKE